MWLLCCSIPLTLILTLILIIYGYLKYYYNYWIRHQVPQVPPNLITGNLSSIICMKQSSAQAIQDMYWHKNAQGQPVVGIYLFHKPALMLREPELIKRILIKDFAKFCNRYATSDCYSDPLGARALFFIKNPAWKEIRSKLTPFFTSTRLKQMHHLIAEVGRNLNNYLMQQTAVNGRKEFGLEIKEVCALYTTDVIATTAFGLQANSFKHPNGSFRHNGREVFRFTRRRALNFSAVFFLPRLVPYMRAALVAQSQTEFFRSTINMVMAEREKSGVKRHDLIDILIDFKNQTKQQHHPDQLKFEGDLLVAQATLFFTAGFESTSATMSFALYELAKSPDVQNKVRADIRKAVQISDGEIDQKVIDSVEYLQMVLDETLRLYPPLPFLERECHKDCDNYSLQPFHSFALPAGTPVYIPVYALHHDPQYYPNPEEFQPERFSAQNKQLLTPYTYLPFGLGPHACIGERLGLLQGKVGLFYFLLNHRVSVGDKTVHKMTLDRKALILQSEGGIHLNVVRDPLCQFKK